jgi:hypothetical protein
MRMDDDSLLVEDVPFDPFERMKQKHLSYAFRRMAADHWGVHELWKPPNRTSNHYPMQHHLCLEILTTS